MTTPLRVTTRVLEDDRPLTAMLPHNDGLVWLRRGEGMVAWGTAVRLTAGTGEHRFARADTALAELSDTAVVDDRVGVPGGGLVGFASMTFDDRTSGSVLVVPRRIVGRRDGRTWLTSLDGPDLTDPVPDPASGEVAAPVRDRVRYAGASIPDVLWLEAVASALERITAGDIDKVVLARDHAVWSHRPFEARWLAERLALRFPDCFTFLVEGLIGATPELLVRRRGDRISALPLAGSRPRGSDPATDAAIGTALLRADKDRREHLAAVASVMDTLAGFCDDLRADDEPFLLRLDNVQHLATQITGTATTSDSALAIAGRLHPTAAVGGTPTPRALRLIRQLEGMDRGRYAGPVGWVAADGDGEFGIALRCAELSGARARLFAGAGIVAGSLPEDELEETRVKLRAMQGALDE